MVVPVVGSLFGDDAVVFRERDVQLLLVSTMFPILDSAMISPVIDSLIAPYGTTPSNVGLLISFWTAPGIVMIPIAGLLADRYGIKPILVDSLLVLGTAGTVIAFTTDFRLVLGLRFVPGVGYRGLVPIIMMSIGDTYAGPREATGQGLRLAVNGASETVFPLITGTLVVLAWQYPFLLYAIAIPAAAAMFFWFDEPTTADSAGDPSGGSLAAYSDELFRLASSVARPPW